MNRPGQSDGVPSLRMFDVIVLAAGSSRRFPAGNKLVTPYRGIPLIRHILRTVAGLDFRQRIIVTGPPYRDDILAELKHHAGWREGFNARAGEGMGGSIAVGASMLRQGCEGVFICPADMPGITAADFHAVAACFAGPQSICRPVFNGQPGHPVLFGRAYHGRLGTLAGDRGAAGLIADHMSRVAVYASDNPGTVFDCDTPDRFL